MTQEPTEHTGEVAGVPYRTCVPEDWNGDVVTLAFGSVFGTAKQGMLFGMITSLIRLSGGAPVIGRR